MRKAYNDFALILDTTEGSKHSGRPWGVAFGYDFCAEHECGIAEIKRSFGVPSDISVYGVKRRKITQVPKDGLLWVERGGRSGFIFKDFWYEREKDRAVDNIWSLLSLDTAKPGLATAWNEGSFLVTSDDPGQVKFLRELYDSFEGKDVAIGMFRAFLGVNFTVAIASRIPPDIQKLWEEKDKESHEVQKEFKKTGIEELLQKKGKRYFALSPTRKKDGSLEFFLNPMEQSSNNFGRFCLQDLRDWAESKGKIPINPQPKGKP